MRADSGFYTHAIVAVCRRMDVRFSITIRQHKGLRDLIEAIPETDWDAHSLLDGRRRRCGRDYLQLDFVHSSRVGGRICEAVV